MAKPSGIFRRSIFAFFRNYQYYTSAPTLLAFPYAATCLIAQSLVPSSPLFLPIHDLVASLFLLVGIFSHSSPLFWILSTKLSQTILTFLLVSPFALSFLLLSKASVIAKSLDRKSQAFAAWKPLLHPLLVTQLCNSLFMLSANTACLFFLSPCFVVFDLLGMPSLSWAVGGLVYSFVVGNSYVLCNLASVLSGVQREGGFVSIVKAFIAVRGRMATGLWLAVGLNVAFAAIEALFQYRVVVRYHRRDLGRNLALIAMEGIFIAFLYGVFIVLDTVVWCTFWRWCEEVEEVDDNVYFLSQMEILERERKVKFGEAKDFGHGSLNFCP